MTFLNWTDVQNTTANATQNLDFKLFKTTLIEKKHHGLAFQEIVPNWKAAKSTAQIWNSHIAPFFREGQFTPTQNGIFFKHTAFVECPLSYLDSAFSQPLSDLSLTPPETQSTNYSRLFIPQSLFIQKWARETQLFVNAGGQFKQNEVQPQCWNSLLCLHKRHTNHLLYREQIYKSHIIHTLELHGLWQTSLVLEPNSVLNLWRQWDCIDIRLQNLTLNQ